MIARHYYAASANYIDIVESNHYDKEYEQLFASANKTTCLIKWPERLIPIDANVQPHRPTSTLPGDPRGESRASPTDERPTNWDDKPRGKLIRDDASKNFYKVSETVENSCSCKFQFYYPRSFVSTRSEDFTFMTLRDPLKTVAGRSELKPSYNTHHPARGILYRK